MTGTVEVLLVQFEDDSWGLELHVKHPDYDRITPANIRFRSKEEAEAGASELAKTVRIELQKIPNVKFKGYLGIANS